MKIELKKYASKKNIALAIIVIMVTSILAGIFNTWYLVLIEENRRLNKRVQTLETGVKELEEELNQSLSTEGNRKLREQIQQLETINQQLIRDMNPGFELRVGRATLYDPYYYEQHGNPGASQRFWDKERWEKWLTTLAQEGYNVIVYWVEPWLAEAWQGWLVGYKEFPEANEYTAEQSEKVIEQVNWIFHRAHELGMRNFVYNMAIITTEAFAKAHGMIEAPFASWQRGPQWGYRNELTRAFTEAAVAELFQTYPDLDGLWGPMGEAMPGKRSTWYKEAIVPGLNRSGRNPIFVVFNWMMPLEDFLEDIAPKEVYNNTWLSIEHNGEMISDTKPYPISLRWAEQSGLPTIIEIVTHNLNLFYFNSPKFAYEMLSEYKRIKNVVGFFSWVEEGQYIYDLFRQGLGYYGQNILQPYSDEPWIAILEEKFGDRAAAEHFLKAFDASARITPELGQIAWVPHDFAKWELILPYWYWTQEDPRFSYFTSPVQGATLLPLRYYALVVAKFGDGYRDNNGANYTMNPSLPGAQVMIWGHIDYQVTPEAHMRNIRLLGEEALREAELAMITVKNNTEQAQTIYNQMKAYKLLTDYYYYKVLAATSALIYSFGGAEKYKTEAQGLANEAYQSYVIAINFIREKIYGNISVMYFPRGRAMDLSELIGEEKHEDENIGTLFNWP